MKKKNRFFALYGFELLKILKNKVAMITLAVMFVFTFIQGEFEVRGNIDPADLPAYRETDGQVIDDALIGEMLAATDDYGNLTGAEDLKYTDVRDWVGNVMERNAKFKNVPAFENVDAKRVYSEREELIEAGYDSLKLTESEKEYWREKEKDLEKPFVMYDNTVSYGVTEGTSNYGIYMISLIATGIASVFAIETQRRTDPMIRSAINGSKELYLAKVLAGMTYVMASLAMVVLGFFSYVGLVWGFVGMKAKIQITYPLAVADMTMWQVELAILALLITFSFLLTAVALFVSNVTRNGVATMAIVIGGSFGMFIISTVVPLEQRVLSQVTSILSPAIISPHVVYDYRLIKLGTMLTEYQAVPIIYVLLGIVFIAAGYWFYARYEIKNN